MKTRFYIVISVVFLLFGVFSPSSSFAAGQNGANGKKLVVVIADHVGFHEWATDSLKYMRDLESRGAFGLMVTRTDEYHTSETAAYCTLSAGLPCDGETDARLAFNSDEVYQDRPAGLIYSLRTGLPAPGNGVVEIEANALANVNLTTDWKARPGALGTLLRQNGICTATIGNADFFQMENRGAAVVAMDETGVVAAGDVSKNIYATNPNSPLGFETNTDALKKKFFDVYDKCDFIVIDFGDTSRVDRFMSIADADAFQKAKLQILSSLESFLRDIISKIDLNSTQVVVISPTPPEGAYQLKMTLTPILAIGAGIPGAPGLITSTSTRRPGLVKNTDFAVHVCNFFGIAPAPDFIGAPFESKPASDRLGTLAALHDRDSFVEMHMDFLKGIIIWHIALLFICFLASLRLESAGRWLRVLLTGLILWTVPMFLAFLFLAGIPSLNYEPVFTICFFALSGVIGLAAGLIPGYHYKTLALAVFYIVALVADQLTGATLIKNSVLGYYPQIGARFYGIGNEYMGFLVGAPLVLFGFLLDEFPGARKYTKIGIYVLLAGVSFIVGAPILGANFGGLISCAFGFFCMAMLLREQKLGMKTLIFSGIAVVVVVGVFVAAEVFLMKSESHIGRLVMRMSEGGGAAEFAKVFVRKLSINFHLLRVSFWSALFVVSLAITLSFYYFPVDRVRKVFVRFDYFRRAYLAALCGAVVAFLVNDSGIVPGATCLIIPTAGVFLLLFNFDEKKNRKRPSGKPRPSGPAAPTVEKGPEREGAQMMVQPGGGKMAKQPVAGPGGGESGRNQQQNPTYHRRRRRHNPNKQNQQQNSNQQQGGRGGQPGDRQQRPPQQQQKQNPTRQGGSTGAQNNPGNTGGPKRRRRRRPPRPNGPQNK
jgi:hypothetical protein